MEIQHPKEKLYPGKFGKSKHSIYLKLYTAPFSHKDQRQRGRAESVLTSLPRLLPIEKKNATAFPPNPSLSPYPKIPLTNIPLTRLSTPFFKS